LSIVDFIIGNDEFIVRYVISECNVGKVEFKKGKVEFIFNIDDIEFGIVEFIFNIDDIEFGIVEFE
jgi:hypothetical protein